MDKTAIKNFAVRARNKLIEDVTQKAYELGISKDEIKDINVFEGGFTIKGLDNSKTYKKYQEKQRRKLVENINQKGFDQVIEEVAYTWFNRFIALRFMEVNDYLPTGVRILSSVEKDKVEPDIIKEALNVDLDLDEQLVYKLIDENDTEDLYRYLLVKQCNELGKIMPQVFEEISDYTELLLPDNLLGEGSVIRDLVESIKEEDYKDQVEIIGWMYQYYNQEKRDEIFDSDMSNRRKLVKNDIPAATQIFTPKWIVRFIVQNSLGRFCKENSQYDDLGADWEFYLDNDDLRILCNTNNIDPKNIKVIDPSMGSGHILVYCFDILYEIYIRIGYSEREIPKLILENNLYGLEIDDRASQLAIFSLHMKARSKNRRIFRSSIKLNLCSIQESNYMSKDSIEYFINNNDEIRNSIEYLIHIFHDAKVYGSILEVDSTKLNLTLLEERLFDIKNEEIKDLFQYQHKDEVLEKIEPLLTQAKVMTQKYHITVTNPPYMGNRRMVDSLKKYANKEYPDVKNDLFAMFTKKSISFTKQNGFIGLVTPYVWWFISSFEKLRKLVLKNTTFTSLIQLEYNAFEGATMPVGTFVLRNKKLSLKGEYIKLSDFKGIDMQPIKVLEAIKNPDINYRFSQDQDEFFKIPGNPIAFWISRGMIEAFNKYKPLNSLSAVTNGMFTCNNNLFLKMWYEVNRKKINLQCGNTKETINSEAKWYPYNKGGEFRKWYGNHEYVINFFHDGKEVRKYRKDRGQSFSLPGQEYYFRESISWSFISSTNFGVRYYPNGFIFDIAGSSVFPTSNKDIFYITAFLCSKIAFELMQVQNPTLNFQAGNVASLPLIEHIDMSERTIINQLCKKNIEISKTDWDSFETSWNFKYHPLLKGLKTRTGYKKTKNLERAFNQWSNFTNEQFVQLKVNEKELNRIFIELYGLQDELTLEINDRDITITRIYDTIEDIPESMKGNNYVLTREDVIKSFISYAVGCMFGRYSLDEEGLVYAGGDFDINRYKTFIPTSDNILVISDDDYFEDDIVSRFVDFVRITFGEDTLEENLEYIAESLGQRARETARQTIRRYFLKDFYKDHVKTYQKRPIYWEFNSGRQDGFKALIYMHRYDPYTVSRVRTDYLHKLQRMYEAEVDRIDMYLENPDITPREKSASTKKKQGLLKQIEECLAYDQVIGHVANQKIDIDLDDGVKVNYAKFQGMKVPQGEGRKPLKANLLSKI